MQDVAGKVAVITGGASGIGFGMATRFAQAGMRVVIADIEEPVLEQAVARLQQDGAQVLGVPTDVSNAESVELLAARTLETFGGVHVLCNNAGVGGGFANIWEASLKDWQWILGVNLWGVVHGVHTFVPIMLERGDEGHIVNTASVAGLTPGTRVYSVTKHAVVALSEALHHNLQRADSRLRVSVLCPGLTSTRIMYAFRNRPAELYNAAGVAVSQGEAQRADRVADLALSTGMPPEQVGSIVLEAIRNEQFWILTHDTFQDAIRTRVEDILERRTPTPYRSQLADA
jgi:NAD(P)-dependent dehydrogenase (short-subunit alcohol dehydrogenase family)